MICSAINAITFTSSHWLRLQRVAIELGGIAVAHIASVYLESREMDFRLAAAVCVLRERNTEQTLSSSWPTGVHCKDWVRIDGKGRK